MIYEANWTVEVLEKYIILQNSRTITMKAQSDSRTATARRKEERGQRERERRRQSRAIINHRRRS